MLAHWPIRRGVPVLYSLVRQAYRSLHFYDAAATSTAVAALGQLREPPLSAHALILSVLTVLPGFISGKHVAWLFEGLSHLRIAHPMLTAHLLKRYVRCCFGEVGGVEESTSTEDSMAIARLQFVSSLATVLRTIDNSHKLHSSQFIIALLHSVEEVLEAGHRLILAPYHNLNNSGNLSDNGDAIDEVRIQRSKQSVAEYLFLVIRCILNESYCHHCTSHFTRLECLLAPLVVHLNSHQLFALLAVVREVCTNALPWRVCGEKTKRKLGVLQSHLLRSLSSCDILESLSFSAPSSGEIIAFLWQLNHFDVGVLAPDVQRGLHHLANIFCHVLEQSPLSLDTIWQLTADDLVGWKEAEELSLNSSMCTIRWRSRPLLGPFLNALQRAVEQKGGVSISEWDNWRAAETILVLCYRLLCYSANGNITCSQSLGRVCGLACVALGKLRFEIGEFSLHASLQMFAAIEAVRAQLLRLLQDSTFFQMDFLLALTEALVEYEDRAFSSLNKTQAVGDEYIQYLYCVLRGQQQRWLMNRRLSFEPRNLVGAAVARIGARKTATCNTAGFLTRVLSILRSKELYCALGSGNAEFTALAESSCLSRAVDLLCGTLRSSEWGSTHAHRAFSALLELLLVLSPLEQRRDEGKWLGITLVARIPESGGILDVIYSLLKGGCVLWISKALPCSKGWDIHILPLLDASVIAERYARLSRSSKQWQMEEYCLDDTWYDGDKPTEENGAPLPCFHLGQQRTSTAAAVAVVELALWLSAFRFGVALGETRSYDIERSSMNMSVLRQLHAKILEGATYLVCSDESEVNFPLRQRLLRAFHLESLCEALLQLRGSEPIFLRHTAFVSVVPFLVLELYRAVSGEAAIDKGSDGSGERARFCHDELPVSCATCGGVHALKMDAGELVSFLVQIEDEFEMSGVPKRPLCVLHEIVWGSLTCIASLNSALEDWIEGFRQCRSFHARDVYSTNTNDLHRDDSDYVIRANTRNTLLWSLLLLASFLRHRCVAQDASTVSLQLASAQRAVARLVQLVSNHTPVLQRRRPAPETLFALSLCEAMDEAAAFRGADEFVLVVLAEVVCREEEQLHLWETAFRSVAERVRRYLKADGVAQEVQ